MIVTNFLYHARKEVGLTATMVEVVVAKKLTFNKIVNNFKNCLKVSRQIVQVMKTIWRALLSFYQEGGAHGTVFFP